MPYFSFSSARLTPKALSRAMVSFIVLVGIALVFATLWQINESSKERIATAKISVSNIVRAVEQQAQDTIQQADNTLRDLAERVSHDGLGDEQRLRLSNILALNTTYIEGIQGLFIYNARGDWEASSFPGDIKNKNNGDRAYFSFHRDNTDKSVYIGSIIRSRTTGEMVIPISRRIDAADGSFAGVALATVPVAYFNSFFEKMDVDENGVIFIALDNGELLARRPTITALMTTNLSKGDIFSRYLSKSDSGTATLISVVDKVERIYAYRRIAGLPIVAAAGVSSQYVFAPWWSYVYRSLILVGIIVIILAFLGGLLYRQIKQLVIAEKELNTARNELEIISQTDSLTSLANRRCFDIALKKEWRRAQRNQSNIAIILMDIDWFKQYNDHYGHINGDECLRKVANSISKVVSRAGDLAARYGGEEFVILLPETDLAGALTVAENVRLAIIDAGIEHSGSPLGMVTISAGAVVFFAPEIDSYTEALVKADKLLYQAKKFGRNLVKGS